ncbi:single-stranded DNA-binding protein [Bombilactobacillus folatiphilus]|uniref:Single-stranded DNA-binding protein n=1 Tax=Bombilactobacillus folatiphilus TaxID=2923362 RepID=A0ABY4P8S8_9LACO|nr:single-stranded DNA-binding protein [Bombilactobacillus folatiphilus]UQS82123.1 single-stranded DNA-binding protein [Bombilactobacillus folatiphilus]
MINRSVLVGRLTRDPDLRYTSNGTAVATFTVAVNRQFTNSNGERDADFINCVIWRKSAENFANFTHKGSLVGIDGRIQTRNYENQQGQRVYVTEVVVENFSLLEPKSANSNNNNGGYQNPAGNNAMANSNPNSTNNFNNNTNQNSNAKPSLDEDPFADNTQSIDISDDDLPF